MASFYGNFNRNTAVGGKSADPTKETEDQDRDMEKDSDRDKVSTSEANDLDSGTAVGKELSNTADKRERSGSETASSKRIKANNSSHGNADDKSLNRVKEQPVEVLSPAEKNRRMREARAEKLAQARVRYFQRIGKPIEA